MSKDGRLSQSIRCYKRLKSCAGSEKTSHMVFSYFRSKKNGYPGILTQSMAMKSAPIIPPRIRGFTTATFSLVTSIIGTDLNLALPFMSIAFSKARFNSYKLNKKVRFQNYFGFLTCVSRNKTKILSCH